MAESYEVPEGLLYTKDHEWVKVLEEKERKVALVGITDYAQRKLREVVYIELPNINKRVEKRETLAYVESVKASSDIYAPVSGVILEVNSSLIDSPELINESPYEKGWVAKIEIAVPEELETLMEPEEYKRYTEGLEEKGEERAQ